MKVIYKEPITKLLDEQIRHANYLNKRIDKNNSYQR